MPECDREAWIMREPGPTMAVCVMYINSKIFAHSNFWVTVHFTRTHVDQSFLDRMRGHRGCRPVLHDQRSVLSIKKYFVKQILLKNLFYVCYITLNLLLYVSVYVIFVFATVQCVMQLILRI